MEAYELIVIGEEVDFEPIQAADVHDAARQARAILAKKSIWAAGTEPFTASVIVRGPQATVKMPVECATAD